MYMYILYMYDLYLYTHTYEWAHKIMETECPTICLLQATEQESWLHTLDQIDMVDIYRVFHPTTRKYTFFSVAHRTFSKIDHILEHKSISTNLKKSK
jgi:exonuclease III